MRDGTNLPVPERTEIRGDCATLFVSLELSRSTWVATSLAPGSKKMSKHTLAGGGNGRELLGPETAKWSRDLFAPVMFAGCYAIIAAL